MNMKVEVVRYFSGHCNIKQQSTNNVALKVKLENKEKSIRVQHPMPREPKISPFAFSIPHSLKQVKNGQ